MTRNQAGVPGLSGWARVIATSLGAAAAGLMNLVFRRGDRAQVELRPGDPAPDFELPGSDGRTYRLSEFRGREAVVVAWFPKAFTAGCLAECASLHASRDALGMFGARYFAVSTDAPLVNRQFAQSLGIEYPILSDPEGAVARAYGVLGASGFPARWTFYVARDGRIAAIDKRVRPSTHGRDVAAMLRALNVPERIDAGQQR
jgi:peroxiredoxin Q/BCP